MNTIEKIRAEIERRRNSYLKAHDKYNRNADYIAATEDLRLLEFLDTLESENPVPNDLEEAKEAYCEEHNDDCFDATGDKCPHIRNAFTAGAKWDRSQIMQEAVKWLVDDDYDELTDKGRFILGSAGIGYNGYYIPYSDLLKLPKDDKK
jgi:hypothetical protein